MLIRRRTVHLALHQKSTTLTVGSRIGEPGLAAVPPESESGPATPAPRVALETNSVSAPAGWLRKLLTSGRRAPLVVLLLLAPATLRAQQGCFHSPEAPTGLLLLVGSLGCFAGPRLIHRLRRPR